MMIFSDLISKPVVIVSPGLISEPVVAGFMLCASKSVTMI
jgi:hypothetical protein